MNDKDKRQLARLRTLEFKEKEQKNKDDYRKSNRLWIHVFFIIPMRVH